MTLEVVAIAVNLVATMAGFALSIHRSGREMGILTTRVEGLTERVADLRKQVDGIKVDLEKDVDSLRDESNQHGQRLASLEARQRNGAPY